MHISNLKHDVDRLQEKLHALYGLNRAKTIDLSFRPPFLNLLKAFGNPQLSLPPVIHVAGTNGKGSIIAMLRSVLEEAGYRVHVYTSPHLIKFNERIVLGHEGGGRTIDDEVLEALIDEALALNDGGEVTFFEVTTAMALAAFSRFEADICLLEVGMGGRLDCTNVIEDPILSVINAIGYDHQEHLGDSLAAIAGEKAGIMKAGVPCVVGRQTDRFVGEGAMDVFTDKANAVGAALHMVDEQDQGYEIGLSGAHQRDNLAVVLKSLALIGDRFPVDEAVLRRGLANTHWPGRLQKLDVQHFGFSADWEIYLDGGHNADAGQALARQAQEWTRGDDKPLIVIAAMMQGKDAKAFLAPIMRHTDRFFVVGIENEPMAMSAEGLYALFEGSETATDYRDALALLKNSGVKPSRILICGSLYQVGRVLA